MREPLPIRSESLTEARSFLTQAKYFVKKGRPLAEVLKNIRERDIGTDGKDLVRAEILKYFDELVEKNQSVLETAEKEAAAKSKKETPKGAVPVGKKREVADPLKSARQARPEEIRDERTGFLGVE